MCVYACARWSRAPMPSTSAPDAPGTAIWLANTPPTPPPQKGEFAMKRENEWKWVKMSVCVHGRGGGGACARQREGREAEKSNSWRVRSGTCCPLGSADRSTPPPTTHTNVLNTPTRLNSYIHTRPGSNTDYVMTYISAKPYWSKMKKQMACWCDSTVWVSPLNLSDTLPSP